MNLQEWGEFIASERMKQEIEKIGDKEAWRIIEDISDAKQRIRYRKFFLLAGGKMPERS